VGFFGNIIKAADNLSGITRIGSLQQLLIRYIKENRFNNEYTYKTIGEISTVAWNYNNISNNYKSVGFTYNDFEVLLRYTTTKYKNLLVEKKI